MRAGKLTLFVIFGSLVRRILIGLVVTYGDGNILVQYYFVHFSSIYMLTSYGYFRPLVSRWAHIL